MITTEYSGEGCEITFHHNGHYSGEVTLVVPSDIADAFISGMDRTTSVKVPYAALEQLVLDKLRSEQIELLENADYPELKRLLGLI